MDLEEALHDLEAISAIAERMTRRRDDIHGYLSSVYRAGLKWLALTEAERRALRKAVIARQNRRVDPRAAKTLFRFLIELTLDCDTRLKWRYAKALRYARSRGCRPEDLAAFFRDHGGIEGCARQQPRR